jgi:uncharacterized protein YdaU (DUF1376 family)
MDTAGWTPTEVGVYLRLLLHEWVNGALPNDINALARISGADRKTMGKFWSTCVGKKFSQNSEGGWENSRLELTRKEQQDYREKKIISGRLGGLKTQESKREKSIEPSSENKALQSSPSSSLNKVSKDTLPTKTTITKTYTADFLSFWNAYPKKSGSKKAHLITGKLPPMFMIN